jgi:hypothetical protein
MNLLVWIVTKMELGANGKKGVKVVDAFGSLQKAEDFVLSFEESQRYSIHEKIIK